MSAPTNADFGTVAHWNKVLTSTEVNAIKDLGRHGNLLDSYSDNLKLYYAMSGLDAKTGLSDTTTTIYDRSGNSNHGTPVSIASADLKAHQTQNLMAMQKVILTVQQQHLRGKL